MLATLKPYTTFLVCCAVAAALGVSLGTEYNWLVAGCCLVILVAGLPHGAFDLYILADLFKGRSFFWAIVGYLALIILTVLFWWLAPQLFLIGFLSYSAFHFGDSDWPADSVVNRLGWGSAIVTLPCLLAPDQVTALFTIVLNTPSMPLITDVLGFIAILATLSSCIEFASRKINTCTLILLSFYSTVCFFAGAIVAFTCYFAFLHGPHHLQRWRLKLPNKGNLQIYLVSFGVLATILLLGVFTVNGEHTQTKDLANAIDATVVRYTFVALAALTVPHMVYLFVADHLSHKEI